MLNPRLTIKHLQMLHAIASAGTMTRAAELLNISQPALSSRLQDAEKILGTRLFIRRGRRLTISAPGTLLLRSASSILEDLTQIENVLMNLPDQIGQVLRIGMPQYASFSWLPMAIKEFEKSYPSVELQIVSEAALQPRSALVRNEIDLALVSSPDSTIQVDTSRFHCRHLFADEFIALLPSDHSNAGKDFLVAEDFLNETYITNSSVPEKNREYELFFQPQGVSPERIVQVGFTEAILELVAAGIGTTISTRWIMESYAQHEKLSRLPLNEEGLHLHWFAICSRRKEIAEQAVLVSNLIAKHRRIPSPAREAGVVLHISSLPGRFGIGEIGAEAQRFIATLGRMKMSVWQFLPLGPTAYGDSPYQPLSTFAGNEMLIDIQSLIDDGLLSEAEVGDLTGLPSDYVDYASLIPAKSKALAIAAGRFLEAATSKQLSGFRRFTKEHDGKWLHDYALFRLLKSQNDTRPWYDWPTRFAQRDPDALRKLAQEFDGQLRNIKVLQYLFFEQWRRLRAHANRSGVRLFADMPIYLALDSADAWAQRELLQVDPDGAPERVAGVPPDYFSEDGQLWGNPLYNWDHHRATGYQWWIDRLRASMQLADLVRIDHFRGFESYWTVAADAETARTGTWEAGPGDAIFDALKAAIGPLPIVAEDLGFITDEVNALRDRQQLPGMAVLQFMICEEGFDAGKIAENRVCYSGTHDNDTTLGWFRGSSDDPRSAEEIHSAQQKILQQTGGTEKTVSLDIIKMALATPARIAIAPIQDILGLGSEARLNTPGTSSGNWRWRLQSGQISPALCDTIAMMVQRSVRQKESNNG